MKKIAMKNIALAAALLLPYVSNADVLVVKDDFTLSAAQNNWTASGGACLTAGDGKSSETATSIIPACAAGGPGGTTGSLPDTSGKGALRLTNNNTQQSGSIVYNANFPTDQGIQATFTTFAYNGDSGGDAKLGADGISFFLLDGTLPAPANVGATGGSLGYSCSNTNPSSDGITGGYIGLGMDEFGNFANASDNTATGKTNGKTVPNSIVLRGGGTITKAYLKSIGKSSPTSTDVQNLCKTGKVDITVTTGSGHNQTTTTTTYKPLNYPYITSATLPVSVPLQSSDIPLAQSKTKNRPDAIPVTYKLKITPSGLLSLWYSYNGGSYSTVIADKNIIDEKVSGPLPDSFRFGFSAGTGGSTNIHELSCFIATPANVVSSSGGINTVNGAQVVAGTQVYFPQYHPDNWWGQLTANSVVVIDGEPSISDAANWDASCNLTGGPCAALGTDADGKPLNSVTAQALSTRTVLTSNGSGTGIPFTWTNGITNAQQTALNIGPSNTNDGKGQDRLDYLRGNRTKEQTTNLRPRTGVLGDIIDSSPTWVGPPNRTYPVTWVDRLYPTTTNPETPTTATPNIGYATFSANNATRTNVVYVGSNDGMVHGFRAGSYNIDGTYNTSSTNDGKDVLSYVPATVVSKLSSFTDPLYSHNYYANATPGTGDLFYNGAWHTWLVGGIGAGGKAIYALDVTDPTQFSEANASSLVVGEWTNSTLANLGDTYGTPLIRRMHNGQWAIIFGNGFNSAGGKAGIYIMTISPTTGDQTFYWLPTGTGTTAAPSGIAYVGSADLDSDRVVDYLYAGDLAGNVWRFDVTSSNTSDWGVSTFGNATGTPIFTARDSNGAAQPITTQIQVTAIPTGVSDRVLLMFATGQKTPFTATAGDIYASGTQSVYGIWDWDMSKWNNGGTTANRVVIPASSTQYFSLSARQSITRSKLAAQPIVSNDELKIRTLDADTNAAVCWQGSRTCGTSATDNTQFGWVADLPATGEQVVYNPVFSDGALELNTTIPPPTGASTCLVPVPTGWTMAFNPLGGAFPKSFFQNDSNMLAMGIQRDAAGSVATFSVGRNKYIYGQNTSGGKFSDPINPPPVFGKRITWKQTQ